VLPPGSTSIPTRERSPLWAAALAVSGCSAIVTLLIYGTSHPALVSRISETFPEQGDESHHLRVT